MPLDPAPRAPVDEGGEPRFGTDAGTVATTDLAPAAGRLAGLRRARRWQWFFAADDEYAVGGTIVSLGPVGQVFVWVADPLAGRLVVDRARLRPGPLVSLADATVGPLGFRYRQPLGRWRGTVAGERIATAVGVAEDHRARW
jgi:hypothetical protein